MTKRWLKVGGALLSVALVAISLLSVSKESEPGIETLEQAEGYRPSDCWFPLPEQWQIQCGHFYTGQARGAFILPVVVIRDPSSNRRSDPLVYLTGGPGSSSFLESRSIDHWFYWLETANLSRDLILVDQRGTGLSEPAFHCHGYESGLRKILGQNLSLREEHQALYRIVEECFALLGATGWSFETFSTSHSARDMSAVMEGLGYETWNILGTSYGSRLALEWLRQDEERIRAVILDSVYPLDRGSLSEWPELLHRSFEAFWSHCARQSWCTEEGEAEFWQALEQLQNEPRSLTVKLHGGGWPAPVVVNGHRLMSAVYAALYDDTLHQHIPAAIKEVLGEGEESLTRLISSMANSQLAVEFNPMVYLAVDCAESAAPEREDYESVRARYPAWSNFTEHAWDYDLCQLVPRRPDLVSFKQNIQTNVPALILSGGLDPVTPHSWARELADALPGAQHWHVPDVGHGVVASRACIHEALHHFLDVPQQVHSHPCP